MLTHRLKERGGAITIRMKIYFKTTIIEKHLPFIIINKLIFASSLIPNEADIPTIVQLMVCQQSRTVRVKANQFVHFDVTAMRAT